MASEGRRRSQKLNNYLCSHCLGGGGGGGNLGFAAGPVPQLLADWLKKANGATVSLPRVLFCLSPPWVPGVWTLYGPHLLLCSNNAGVLQPPPLTPLSRCPVCPECGNPATPICPATCLLVFKYPPAIPPLLGSSPELLPPTCPQLPTKSSHRTPLKMTSHFCWWFVWHDRGEARMRSEAGGLGFTNSLCHLLALWPLATVIMIPYN